MKKFMYFLIAISFAIAPTSVLAYTPAPGGPFNSAFRVQNLETSDATCVYSLYNSSGEAQYTSASTVVHAGDSLYVYVPDLSLSNGQYSAVVSCDKKVAAVSNFGDDDSGASHEGISDPATVWYAPGIYDNYYGFYSNIVVQNASSSSIDITVEIFAPGSSTPVKEQIAKNVPANASVSFEQEGLEELDTNQFYSAKITGTGNIAPIVNIYGSGSSSSQLYSYNAFKSGATKVYAPIVMNNYYGYNTALVIQNMGDNNANVKVTYTNGHSNTYTIQPGAPESIYTPSVSGIPAGNTLYGATIESTNGQPIVVLVNQSNSLNRAASYTGFSSGSTEVRAPIVMKNYYTFDSSVVCQNIGDTATTMSITYASGNGPTASVSINPGGVHQFYQPADPALDGVGTNYISSAVIEATQPIVCVVNQDKISTLGNTAGDFLYSYEGIAP